MHQCSLMQKGAVVSFVSISHYLGMMRHYGFIMGLLWVTRVGTCQFQSAATDSSYHKKANKIKQYFPTITRNQGNKIPEKEAGE